MTFEEFGLSEDVMRGLDAMNFKEATPVQEQTIPVILQKKRFNSLCSNRYGKDGRLYTAITESAYRKAGRRR